MTDAVLHATLRYPPALGGVETYVRDIVEHATFPQSVVTSGLADHLTWTQLDNAAVAARPDYVCTLAASRRLGGGYPWLSGLAGHLRGSEARIIHAHGMYYPTFDLPLVVAATDAAVVVSPYTHVRPTKKGAVYRRGLRGLLGRAAHLVFLTEAEAALFYQFFPNLRGLPATIIPPLVRSVVDDAAVDGDLVVIVGRIDEGKGSKDIPQLCHELVAARPNTRVQVFGASSELTTWLEQEALNPELHLEVFADADGDLLDAAVRRAAVFVTPTRYEAFGIAAVEAAAAGVPVVGYEDAGALPAVLSHPGDFLSARSRDICHLAESVLSILAAPEERHVRGARRERYSELYGVERWKSQWNALYGSLM